MSKRRSNKSIKQMIDSVYNCGNDYWHNLKIREQVEIPDQFDTAFDKWRFDIGISRTSLLTASELKGE